MWLLKLELRESQIKFKISAITNNVYTVTAIKNPYKNT
jgi:hypothetical protein